MDDRELDRIDLCHVKYSALLDKKLFLAPISEDPQRVLDLGCGTGKISTPGLRLNAILRGTRYMVHRHGGRVSWCRGMRSTQQYLQLFRAELTNTAPLGRRRRYRPDTARMVRRPTASSTSFSRVGLQGSPKLYVRAG